MTELLPANRILVTGASGKVGRLLRLAWQRQSQGDVVWLSRKAPADIVWAPDTPLPQLPNCGTVIALWGRTTGTPVELSVNETLVAQAQRVALACGAERVLHFSSAAVYGPGTNLGEASPPQPTNAYGIAKCMMEAAVRALPASSPRHCCLRLANIVGADSLAPALRPSDVPATLDRFADGGGPVRSYVSPSDLARVLAGLARVSPDTLPVCLNVTAPKPVAMADLLHAAGRSIRWREAGPDATQTVTLDGGRLVQLLRFRYLNTDAERMLDDFQGLETTT